MGILNLSQILHELILETLTSVISLVTSLHNLSGVTLEMMEHFNKSDVISIVKIRKLLVILEKLVMTLECTSLGALTSEYQAIQIQRDLKLSKLFK